MSKVQEQCRKKMMKWAYPEIPTVVFSSLDVDNGLGIAAVWMAVMKTRINALAGGPPRWGIFNRRVRSEINA